MILHTQEFVMVIYGSITLCLNLVKMRKKNYSHKMFYSMYFFNFLDSLGQVNKVKFCDYQLVSYGSFVHDLIFFLYTSVNSLDRKLYIEHFFEHYHSHFYNTLRLFHCPLDDYTYEKLVLFIIIIG